MSTSSYGRPTSGYWRCVTLKRRPSMMALVGVVICALTVVAADRSRGEQVVSGHRFTHTADELSLPQAGHPREALRVMTFNIRFNNPNDGPNAWPHRKEIVADLIRERAPDLLGLQEALSGQVEYLIEALPEYESFGAGRDDGERRGEQVPVFFRKDRFRVVDRGHFWLSTTPDVAGSKDWDAAITRMTTWLTLEDVETEQSFIIANTHFDHVGRTARLESARLIRSALADRAGDQPIILTGDFNCLSDSRPYQAIVAELEGERSFQDSHQICQIETEGPNSTWCGFREVEAGRRIDYIFVSGEVDVVRHQTLDQQIDGRFPSDHLPVLVELSWR